MSGSSDILEVLHDRRFADADAEGHAWESKRSSHVRFVKGSLLREASRADELASRRSMPLLELVQGVRTQRAGAGFWNLPDVEEWRDQDVAELAPLLEMSRRQHVVPPVVWKPAQEATKEKFTALQRWEGIVTECLDNSFVAQLTDLTSEGPAEEVELALEDVAAEDHSLVEIGAVFYWSIGYRDDAGGQRWRASTLRFRRLPVWSSAEIDAAKERARELAKIFGGNSA